MYFIQNGSKRVRENVDNDSIAHPVAILTTHHPGIFAFEQALRTFRDRDTEHVESIARFVLPFQVKTSIFEQSALPFLIFDGTKIMHATL